MSDWIEWKGGECPVPADTAVAVHLRLDGWKWGEPYYWSWAHCGGSKDIVSYRVINQHRIEAALKRGIELGLEAAHKAIEALYSAAAKTPDSDDQTEEQIVLEDASMAVCALDPETIAQEAQHD